MADKETCECINHMAVAMMELTVAMELAEAIVEGREPEWVKNQKKHGNYRPPEEHLKEYAKATEKMLDECGLSLTHVYPFRSGRDPRESWRQMERTAEEIAQAGGFDTYTFDMLNEALVVGSECWEKR